MKIGFSLSHCVKDIIHGKVEEEDVYMIHAGTCARTPSDWDSVIEGYRFSYWSDNPELGENVARRLIMHGKVDQPRTRGEEAPNLASGPVWADVENPEMVEYLARILHNRWKGGNA